MSWDFNILLYMKICTSELEFVVPTLDSFWKAAFLGEGDAPQKLQLGLEEFRDISFLF